MSVDDGIVCDSGSAQAAMIAARKIGCRELLELYIARIERYDGLINAVIWRDFESARRHADLADSALCAGESWGVLHGVPMTIKDAFCVSGMVSTGGDRALAGFIPEIDAEAVSRLREAGAIFIGKTNVPLYSADWQSFNDPYGRTNNPYDVSRTPGGSSGGSAAAVSACFSACDIGSDIGGSVRIPAHFCNLYGLKPSYGLIPRRGHIPPGPAFLGVNDLSVAGPICRSGEDVRLLFNVMAGPRAEERALRLEMPFPRPHGDARLRVGVVPDHPFSPVETAVRAGVIASAKALESMGAIVEDVCLPVDFHESNEIYALLLHGIMTASLDEDVRSALIARGASFSADDCSHEAYQSRGAALSYAEGLALNHRREAMKARWLRFFEDYDVLLCPPVNCRAFAHDTDRPPADRRLTINGEDRHYFDLYHWSGLATLVHIPAMVTPLPLPADGLPTGVQIIGTLQDDMTVISVASLLESYFGTFSPPSLSF